MSRMVTMRIAAALCLSLAVLIASRMPASAQRIPDIGRPIIPNMGGPWEIGFGEIELAAGLPEMQTLPFGAFEARLMTRPWSAQPPVPFLRLVQLEGRMEAALYEFWNSNHPEWLTPKGLDAMCRGRVCVRPLALKEQQDWMQFVGSLAAENACPIPRNEVSVCGDCPQLDIKTLVNGQYREQNCQNPRSATLGAQMMSLMSSAQQTARKAR